MRQHLLVVEHASLTPHQATRSLWPTRGLLAGCPGIRGPCDTLRPISRRTFSNASVLPATVRHDQIVDAPRAAWQLRRIVRR